MTSSEKAKGRTDGQVDVVVAISPDLSQIGKTITVSSDEADNLVAQGAARRA